MTTPSEPIDESGLVQRARRGDTGAFDALHLRHVDRAWRLACAVTGAPALAPSTVAEGFGTTFAAIAAGRRRTEEPFGPALLVAVRNAGVDARRAAAADARAAVTTAPFAQAFGQLPERWRSVLWLTLVEHLTIDAAAPIVGLAPEATAQLAKRARDGLIERYLHEDLAATGDRNCARAVNRLASYAGGRLAAPDAEGLERHLDLCAHCDERFRRVSSLDHELTALAVPTPMLLDRTREAWAAAISKPRRRSATGLSPRTEKILAGVSAVVAAAGVVGAASFDRGPDTAFEEAVVDRVAGEVEGPDALEIGAGPDLPPFVREARALPFSRPAPTDAPGHAPLAVGSDGGAPAVAGELAGTDGSAPATPSPAPVASQPEPLPVTGPGDGPGTTGAAEDEAALSIGTTIADLPVAVEVAPDPGVTVGPVNVGSAPQPESQGASAGAPLASTVGPVSEVTDADGVQL